MINSNDAISLLKLNNILDLNNFKQRAIKACESVKGIWTNDTWDNAVDDCIKAIERIEPKYIGIGESGKIDYLSLANLCNIPVGITAGNMSESKLNLLCFAIIKTYEQSLTDPENQPSQFGTVPLEWYENLENKLGKVRFNVSEVIDSLDGSYEKHAIRKKLQKAIEQ